MSDLLAKIVAQPEQPFALLYRPDVSTEKLEVLQLLRGETHSLQEALSTKFTDSHEKLILVPFCQVARRGYQAVDDKTPILNMPVISRQWVPLPQALNLLPNTPIIVRDTHFNLDDIQFGQRVKNLVTHEIGEGLGSNFVLHRKLRTRLVDYHSAQLFSLYRRLLQTETSAYWCFLISTGEQAFVGASPELQVSLQDGEVCMNPISGTFKYPKQGSMIDQLSQFLNNLKEINELYMVVDEELKVMSKLCTHGAQVSDLHLKQLSQIIHTEYFLRGKTCVSVLDVLRETLPAPTVTGSPVQQACEVITRYEPEGRRYYSGVVALVDNSLESSKLDSAICIRTAEISADGKVEIGVGATIVRDSEPEKEAEETRIKAQALYTALTQDSTLLADKKTEVVPISEDLNNHRLIQPVLVRRNNNISQFWLANPQQRYQRQHPFAHKKILILDGNDTFTAMLQTLFSALGGFAHVEKVQSRVNLQGWDLIVAGPGPGNPLDSDDKRVNAMREAIIHMKTIQQPFFAVCLSHQLLCLELGLPIIRLSPPNQGVQKTIMLDGYEETVGFYNTFCAEANAQEVFALQQRGITLYSERGRDQVYALRAPTFASVQFHIESILTIDGPRILDSFVTPLLQKNYSEVVY